MFEHAGSISHGTLREEDLVPAFLSKLKELDPERAARIEYNYADAIEHLMQGREHFDQEWLMPELTEALEELAPEGYYFGTAEGDGSDFGFWPTWECMSGVFGGAVDADNKCVCCGIDPYHGNGATTGPESCQSPCCKES